MKRFLLISAILVVASSAQAFWPFRATPSPTPAPAPKTQIVVKKISQPEILSQLRVLTGKLQASLDVAQSAAAEATKQKDEAIKQAADLAANRDLWEKYGKEQSAAREGAEKTVLAQKAALLRRDIIIGVLVLLIGAFLFVKLFLKTSMFGL